MLLQGNNMAINLFNWLQYLTEKFKYFIYIYGKYK